VFPVLILRSGCKTIGATDTTDWNVAIMQRLMGGRDGVSTIVLVRGRVKSPQRTPPQKTWLQKMKEEWRKRK